MKARSHSAAGIDNAVSEPVYPADILSEETLIMAPPDVKGAWGWFLFVLWRKRRGSHTATAEEWGRLWGCSAAEATRLCKEIKRRQIGSVTFRNARITLMSRRLSRREQARKAAARRQKQHRERTAAESNASVTAKYKLPSSSSSSSSSSSPSLSSKKGGEAPPLFPKELEIKKENARRLLDRLPHPDNRTAQQQKEATLYRTIIRRTEKEIATYGEETND